MIEVILFEGFYRPVINGLFGLHSLLPEGLSLGLSLIFYILLIKLALTAFGMLALSGDQQQEIQKAVKDLETRYENSPDTRRQVVRRLLKENGISIAFSMINLFLQGVFLLVFYWYFRFDSHQSQTLLYDGIGLWGRLDFTLFGLNLLQPSLLWTGITVGTLFLNLAFNELSTLRLGTGNKAFQYTLPIIAFWLLMDLPVGLSIVLLTINGFNLVALLLRELAEMLRSFITANQEEEEAEQINQIKPVTTTDVEEESVDAETTNDSPSKEEKN